MASAAATTAAVAQPTSHNPDPSTTTPGKTPIVPNIDEVAFGTLLIKSWYPSFYPEELIGRVPADRIYVCHWCFKYVRELVPFLGHLRACDGGERGPPGVQVYSKGGLSLFEVDGEEHKLYAQNLSLFAKLFLDTKSVFFDATTFLYYVLVADNPSPSIATAGLRPPDTPQHQTATTNRQVVGFFSKEKMSWDNNNLACILVFPPWQKQGLGQVLMGASYELGRRERRLGGPEKPLSDLGLRAYIHYWSLTLARTILGLPAKKTITVNELRDTTFISADDIFEALDAMNVLEHRQRGGASAVINKARIREWVDRNKADLRNPVDPDAFVKPERSSEEESSGSER